MNSVDWQGKPYYSLDAYFKTVYGKKCFKIAIDAGCTCPNRDGTLDTRGCIFCSAEGSGDFASEIMSASEREQATAYSSRAVNDNHDSYKVTECIEDAGRDVMSASEQRIDKCIDEGAARFNKTAGGFVIYFQAFTNTYGDLNVLKELWRAALFNERSVGISIATRPDCLGDEVLTALSETKELAEGLGKFVWVELGLQTIHDATAGYIRRHYPLTVYDTACESLCALGLPYIVHVILGLPGETRDMMLETVAYVCKGGLDKPRPFGIKLQLLHVLKGTDLAVDYGKGMFDTLKQAEYIDLVCDMLEIIPEEIVIHRITGDAPKTLLISPEWSADKRKALNALHKHMKERGVRQGSRCRAGR